MGQGTRTKEAPLGSWRRVMLTSVLILTGGCALISLASRQWRWNALPWGVVTLFVASGLGTSLGLVFLLAAILVAMETVSRPRALLLALPPVAVALAGFHPGQPDLSRSVSDVAVMFVIALLVAAVVHALLPKAHREERSPWTETATGLLLLCGAISLTAGLMLHLPILAIVGIISPTLLPALLLHSSEQTARSVRLDAVLDAARASKALPEGANGEALESFLGNLHGLLEPILSHELTVLAVSPALTATAPSAITCPEIGDELPRIRERARFLFQSGRAERLDEPTSSIPGDVLHLHPRFSSQLLLPVRQGPRVIAFIALLGIPQPAPGTAQHRLGGAVADLVRDALSRSDLANRLRLLEERNESQSKRVRDLLELNQLVTTSTNLTSLKQNLVRGVNSGFGCTWTGLLLRQQTTERFVLAACAGDAGDRTGETGRLPAIGEADIQQLLDSGSTVSHLNVVRWERWPFRLPHPPGVEHTLVASLSVKEETLGYIVIVPHPVRPMPDLDDLRALELVLQQVCPSVQTALHLEEVERQTLQDPLTGIANRRSLDEVLEQTVSSCQAKRTTASFAMVDIDDFKLVNDRYGHRIGDVVLVELAALLSRNVRANDFAARYGGEEFSIVLPGLSYQRASEVLERLREAIARERFAGGELSHPIRLTVSIGVAAFPYDADTASNLVEQADSALYFAKRNGKNKVIGAWELTPLQSLDLEEPLST